MNTSKTEALKRKLQRLRLVPVVSLPTVEAGLKLSEILVRCSLPVAEITFRTACASEAMSAVKAKYPELLLIAGTVLTLDQVDQAVAAGAAGIVSPGFTPKMAAYCRGKGIPFCPGVCTPSEVQMAMEEGLDLLKFFPAENAGGLTTVSLFRAIYQHITFMPTGGINRDNLRSYLAFDNILCCGGTWLSPEQLMVEGSWGEIEKRVQEAVKIVADE